MGGNLRPLISAFNSRISRMDRLPTREQSLWHFSLRELMLLVTAAAAVLALAVKSYPSPPTPFFNQFDAQRELQDLFRELGIKTGSSSGSGGGFHGGGERRREWSFASHQTQHPLGEVGYQFAERVEAALQRAGCNIGARRKHGVNKSLKAFGYSYRRGATSSEFAEVVDLGDGNFHIHAFCFEFTKRQCTASGSHCWLVQQRLPPARFRH
jgi:hypothetical protein